MVLGNHFFQGDSIPQGVRTAGLIMIGTYNSSTIAENYVDNCFIEWTNERDSTPSYVTGYSFSAMSITDNIFYSSEAPPWFSYIVIRPHGARAFPERSGGHREQVPGQQQRYHPGGAGGHHLCRLEQGPAHSM